MIAWWLVACGGTWQPGGFDAVHAGFPLECGHAAAACDACHDPEEPPGPVDGACLACHESERPASHDPVATASCEECHTSCGWDSTSPHPVGFGAPELHGLAFKVQDPTEGDCRACHGAALEGGAAQSCDGCHGAAGIAGWRTDCLLCHGGGLESSGAPPVDIDDQLPVSFAAHTAHVNDDGDYRATPCLDCHAERVDVLDDGHVFDATPAVAEVDFAGGPSDAATWTDASCGNTYCHGPGFNDDGAIDASEGPVSCGSCHATEGPWQTMSGLHQIHLEDGPIVCQDCHADVIDGGGTIVSPARHVDGARDIALFEATITTTDNGGTCEGTCHGYPHDGTGWGHAPGYAAPEVHGQEALFWTLPCADCHGTDLGGGTAQGCDGCHTAGWRSDCSYCHGTGADGLPPSDLDDTVDEALISFQAHPEHADGDTHPLWACDVCHGAASLTFADAFTDPGHWVDATPGIAEVSFTGLAAGATYVGSTCSALYCHGDGRTDGSEVDGSTALPCTSCHGMPANSGDHNDHEHDTYACTECHALTSNPSDVIVGPARHVNGNANVDMDGTTNSVVWNGSTCNGDCHGDDHENESW